MHWKGGVIWREQISFIQKTKTLSKKRIHLYMRLPLFVTILYFAGFLSNLFSGDLAFAMEMPGTSYAGTLPPLTKAEEEIKERLYKHVERLTVHIGERNLRHYENLKKADSYITESFQAMGYDVQYQEYNVSGKAVRTCSKTF